MVSGELEIVFVVVSAWLNLAKGDSTWTLCVWIGYILGEVGTTSPTPIPESPPLMKCCHVGVSPANYSDSGTATTLVHKQFCKRDKDKSISGISVYR